LQLSFEATPLERHLIETAAVVRQLHSVCGRWSPAGVLTLTGTNRPLDPATDAASNVLFEVQRS